MNRNPYIAYGLLAGGALLSIEGGLHRIYLANLSAVLLKSDFIG